MPYIPNARMDRVKSNEEVFTLKYFADFINGIGFKNVLVYDPHSSVSMALFNNVYDLFKFKPSDNKIDVLSFGAKIFYPDEGAVKRYSEIIKRDYIYGMKKRDWETGNITGYEIVGDVVQGETILIIDDICSRGGTFLHASKKLKEKGAGDIYLYVSHCENTVLEGQLKESGLIKGIYTTNSIFTKKDDFVKIIKEF
jgi:ribose-phosphate pyrophosphokinase